MNKLSLFSGCGMDDLASHWAGINTVCMCEKDEWCRKLLSKRFPGIPIIKDVHDVNKKTVYEAIAKSQQFRCLRESANGEGRKIKKCPCTEIESCGTTSRIDLIASGVPCQPASVAGKRLGKRDDRWLWDEAIRIVAEFKPTWVLFENPVGINSLDEFSCKAEMGSEALDEIPDVYSGALDGICADIEKEGYEVQTFNVPACGVGAFHKRHRIFIASHADNPSPARQREHSEICYPSESGLPDWAGGTVGMPSPLTEIERPDGNGEIREVERIVCRMADGCAVGLDGFRPVKDRVNRLKALGNGCVPQQIYPFYKAMVRLTDENL